MLGVSSDSRAAAAVARRALGKVPAHASFDSRSSTKEIHHFCWTLQPAMEPCLTFSFVPQLKNNQVLLPEEGEGHAWLHMAEKLCVEGSSKSDT